MKNKKPYDALLSCRTWEELKAQARIQAIKEGLSLQEYVNNLIIKDLKEKRGK